MRHEDYWVSAHEPLRRKSLPSGRPVVTGRARSAGRTGPTASHGNSPGLTRWADHGWPAAAAISAGDDHLRRHRQETYGQRGGVTAHDLAGGTVAERAEAALDVVYVQVAAAGQNPEVVILVGKSDLDVPVSGGGAGTVNHRAAAAAGDRKVDAGDRSVHHAQLVGHGVQQPGDRPTRHRDTGARQGAGDERQ